MRLHRLAMVELRPTPRYLRHWTWRNAQPGVDVTIRGFVGPEDLGDRPDPQHGLSVSWHRPAQDAPGQVLLNASTDVDLALDGPALAVVGEMTAGAEAALTEAADLLAIASQARHEVYSPRPYVFLEPTTGQERDLLAGVERIALPPLRPGAARLAPGPHLNINFRALLADRPVGVALLSSALSAGRGVAKLHDLMRVFENAFACAGVKLLVDPLTEFLKSYPWDVGYTRDEVRGWIKELRNPATHADLTQARTVLLDPDIEPYLPRVEQAAYDVLFNKRDWHKPDSARLDRWHFKSMIRRDGSAIVSEGGELPIFDQWDHLKAFRLKEAYHITASSLPAGWRGADWYSADPEA